MRIYREEEEGQGESEFDKGATHIVYQMRH